MEFREVVTLRGSLAIPSVLAVLGADRDGRVEWSALVDWLDAWKKRHHDYPDDHTSHHVRGECIWCQKNIMAFGPMPHPRLVFLMADVKIVRRGGYGSHRNRELERRRKEFQAKVRRLAPLVFARDGYRCRACDVSGEFVELHPDHIVPLAEGGGDDLSNLQTLCRTCNLSKGGQEGTRRQKVLRAQRTAEAASLLRSRLLEWGLMA